MRSLGLLASLLSFPALAEPIALVPYTSLEPRLVSREDFESYPRVASPGTSLDRVQKLEGLAVGERFQGQTLIFMDGFDRLSPVPMPPLRVAPGVPGQNLAVSFIYTLSNQMAGLAPPGYPERRAGGEGAIAIQFDRDQFALGFRVAADLASTEDDEPGYMQVSFFRRDASLIATLDVPLGWGFRGYGFLRDGEVTDIAGITITNSDPAGIAIDDVIYDTDLVMGFLHKPPLFRETDHITP